MKQEDEKMAFFLQRHDPVQISSARLEKLHAALWCSLDDREAQAMTSSPTYLLQAPMALPVFRVATMGLLALMLGLFVGQGLEVKTKVSVQSEQKVSVLAMADPWETFIVEKE